MQANTKAAKTEAEASATATRDAHDTEWLRGPEKQAEG